MATKPSSAESKTSTLQVLALHGSEGTGKNFINRSLESLKLLLLQEYNIELLLTAVDAPFPKGEGFAWWTMPPGVRSSTADKYNGFDDSTKLVTDIWKANDFDLVIGHSQGAILLSALLSLHKMPYHPTKGYILNGVAWPNPYTKNLKNLSINKNDTNPKVLVVVGENDTINPPIGAAMVRDALQQANFLVSEVRHPDGHSFPSKKDDTLSSIAKWIAEI